MTYVSMIKIEDAVEAAGLVADYLVAQHGQEQRVEDVMTALGTALCITLDMVEKRNGHPPGWATKRGQSLIASILEHINAKSDEEREALMQKQIEVAIDQIAKRGEP